MPLDPLPSLPADFRIEDAKTFVRVFRRAEKLSPAERTTYTGLFGKEEDTREAYTTVLAQLKRVAAYALKVLAIGPPPQPQPDREPDVEILFARSIIGDGGLQPTPIAKALYKELSPLQDTYENLGQRVATALWFAHPPSQALPLVRIGAGWNFALHILPYILSRGAPAGAPPVRWTMETTNTPELLPRLNNGQLDFVIGYGSKNAVCLRQEGLPGLRIGFTSFDFSSIMILDAHPLVPVLLKNGDDANLGYADELVKLPPANRKKGIEKPPPYKDLRKLRLEDIDFHGSGLDLLITRSWDQPRGLKEFIERAAQDRLPIRYLDSYEEALSLVKLRQGLAVLPQVFSKKRMVHAFGLTPPESFTRWIGAYYNPQFPLADPVLYVLTLIRNYLKKFEPSIRDGHPPGYGDQDFDAWHARGCDIEENWAFEAQKRYEPRLVSSEPTPGDSPAAMVRAYKTEG